MRRRLTARDRFLAWLVTGAPGRGYAFALNFAAAAGSIWRAQRLARRR